MFRGSKKKRILFWFIPVAVFIILQLIFLTPFWISLEHKAQDLLFLLRGNLEISEDIVIVEIGDETFNILKERWPFPREYHARLVENLQKAGVQAIVFDIEFTERTDPLSDEFLAETLAKYDNVILAGKLIKTIYDSSVKEQFLTPITPFTDRFVPWGTVNISADQDGFVRRYEIFQKRKDDLKPSIGLLALAKTMEVDTNSNFFRDLGSSFRLGDRFIPKIGSKTVLLNYFGGARHFPYFDYASVLDDSSFTTPFELSLGDELNEFEDIRDSLKDKIVLIGLTAVEFHDLHYTPFYVQNQQRTPGVEIHANFIEMVLQQKYLLEMNYLKFIGLFFLGCFIFFFLNVKIKPFVSLIINIVVIIIYFGFSVYLFTYQNVMIPLLEIPSLILLMYVVGLIFQYIITLQERKFIKQAFGQYIAPELVEELIKDPKKLEYGGKQQTISVLFSDIVSFTPYTEKHSPRETVDILREYLSAMVDVIMRNKGTLDKFVGDEIIALFGTPVALEDHAFCACKTALEMRQKVDELTEKWHAEKTDPVNIGIGINSGPMIVGNLGSEQIFDYTAIGDNMNTGARIEALTRDYKTKNNIIISDSTYQLCSDKIIAEFIDEVTVKGKSQPIKIYELKGIKLEI